MELARRSTVRRGAGSLDYLGDEIAVALAVSRRSGEALLDRALAMDDAPDVHDALARGELTARKADVLLRTTSHLSTSEAAQVHAAVLPDAPQLTVPQIRRAARRAELLVAPEAAAGRHERARAERCVWLEPAPDAMAWVKAYLPASDAMRVMTGLDALAAAAAREDDRTADVRRADALVDVVGRVLDSGLDLHGHPLPVRQRRRPHLNVTMSLASLVGADDAPAELAGYGPVPAAVARTIAQEARWRFVAVDPRTGEVVDRSTDSYRPSAEVVDAIIDRDVTCTFPGCHVDARRCDLDHTDPFRDDRPAAEQTRTTNLAALCRHHHRMKTHGGWTPRRDPATGVTSWTSRSGCRYTRDPVPVPLTSEPPLPPHPSESSTAAPPWDSSTEPASTDPRATGADPPPAEAA